MDQRKKKLTQITAEKTRRLINLLSAGWPTYRRQNLCVLVSLQPVRRGGRVIIFERPARKTIFFSFRAKAQRRKGGSNTLSGFPALRDFFLYFRAKTLRGIHWKDFLKLQCSSQVEGAAIGWHNSRSWVAACSACEIACIGQVIHPSFEGMLLPEVPTGRKILHPIGRN